MNVNLGIGIPCLLPAQLPSDVKINIHCENGVIEVGPYAYEESQMDPDLINPGKVKFIFILVTNHNFTRCSIFQFIYILQYH